MQTIASGFIRLPVAAAAGCFDADAVAGGGVKRLFATHLLFAIGADQDGTTGVTGLAAAQAIRPRLAPVGQQSNLRFSQ